MAGDELETWREKNPLNKHRTRYNMTIADAATWLSVSVNTINAWEDGRSTPESRNMQILTGLIGTDVDDKWLRWLKSKPQPDVARK